jgi:two-component system, NtrC family, sensor kinase
MKKWLTIFLISQFHLFIHAQQRENDSLLTIINQQNGDKAEVNALAHLAENVNLDSGLVYAQRGLLLAEKINYLKGQADCLMRLAQIRAWQANYSRSIQFSLQALDIFERIGHKLGMATAHSLLQGSFREIGDYRNALTHAFSALKLSQAGAGPMEFLFPGHWLTALMFAEIGQTYLLMSRLDSASYYTQKAIEQKELFNNSEWNFPVYLLATIQTLQGDYTSALNNYRSAIPLAIKNEFFRDTLQIFSGMSTLFKKSGEPDSAIHYARMVALTSNPELETKNLLEAVSNLAEIYKQGGHKDSAIKYIELNNTLKDSIFSNEKNREIQSIIFNDTLKEQEIISAQIKYRSKVQLYALVSGIAILLLIAGLLWHNNTQKQKAKDKIEKAYSELKTTQTQLIQSEKMASLGELTAGIAHEIQNPLNFVNNFSDVNKELLSEMKEEIIKGNLGEAKSIANNLIDNEEKINFHGKRADAIVKGMLQHSRTSSGQNEPTDINALAEEYLRLAYHGLRAKDKSFNAVTKTDFDHRVGKINIVPQEIGRVILNLINNAFYAVAEKQKLTGDGYEPVVTIGTKTANGKVEINVKDNGNGIPQKVLDKIFQPFFTTKPPGQGTGLGLSLSYDIVKAHGGEIIVKTKEGEGTEFIISLPG